MQEHHLNQLRERGWTVVEGVLDGPLCEALKHDWLATMESYGTGFVANDRTTWKGDALPMSTRGMQDWPPVAQEAFVWKARLRTAPVFASLWGVHDESELITSMDRACFVPHERLVVTERTHRGWWHVDQARLTRRGSYECVQGFVTLNPIDEGCVALEVMEGAHHYHKQLFDYLSKSQPQAVKDCRSRDFLKLDERAQEFLLAQPGVRKMRITMPAGALVLWDSRLPHHAMPPRDARVRSPIDRYVIYTCMVPKAWAKASVLRKRLVGFTEGRAFTHWPHDGTLFPRLPRTYGRPVPFNFDAFDASEQAKRRDQELTPDERRRVLALVS